MECCDCAYACCQNGGTSTKAVEVSIVTCADTVHEVVDAIDENTHQTVCIFNADDASRNEIVHVIAAIALYGGLALVG